MLGGTTIFLAFLPGIPPSSHREHCRKTHLVALAEGDERKHLSRPRTFFIAIVTGKASREQTEPLRLEEGVGHRGKSVFLGNRL